MAQAKRSPILGYNHNVKYRGVIFHVQTEDSGQQNPHLFTHLFHEGVIVSTRKYVYDSGSNEDAIKGLMQAQHKAVMKDLKKGTFDDKIDAYLAGTPGLEPRVGADPSAPPLPRGERAKTEATPEEEGEHPLSATATRTDLEIIDDDLSEPIELPLKSRTTSDDRTRPIELPMKGSHVQVESPGVDNDMAAAVAAANAAPPTAPAEPEPPPNKPRVSTAQKVSRSGTNQTPPSGRPMVRPAVTPAAAPRPNAQSAAPLVDITEEEISTRLRAPRDTAVESLPDDIDSTMPVQTARPAAHNAASLPAKPGARPSMSPPVVTRPAPDSPRKRPGDSEAVEIYQAAPPSVDPPPGERSERAGTYSVNRRSGDAPIRETTGRIAALNPAALGLTDPASKSSPVPSGLARPGGSQRTPTGETPRPGGSQRTPTGETPRPPGTRDSASQRVPPNVPREPTPRTVARAATPPPPPPQRPGTPQPAPPRVTAPIQNRTSTPVNPQSNSGVVMTRPAVIVGAPPKPTGAPASTTGRVRKAREDEGRGFGQGLISEKSLDEVILAYLSEDADDK